MRHIEPPEQSDGLLADCDMRPPLALSQAPLRALPWPKAVETFGCVEVEVVLGYFCFQPEKFLNL